MKIIKRLFAVPVGAMLVCVKVIGFLTSILLSIPYWVITGNNLFKVLDDGIDSFVKKNIDPLFDDVI